MPLAVGVLGALAFATELLLWAGVAVAVQAAVGGWLGWVLGLLVAVLVIVAWSVWMAPRASHRIAPVLRAIVAGFGCLGVGQHCSRKARTGGGSLSPWVPSSWWSPNSNLTAGVSLPTRAAASSRLSGHPGGEQLIYLRGGIPGLGEDRARVLAGTGGRAREGGRAPREAW